LYNRHCVNVYPPITTLQRSADQLVNPGKRVKLEGKYYVDTSDTLTLPMFDLPGPEMRANGFHQP
jgi:hypothetical protein